MYSARLTVRNMSSTRGLCVLWVSLPLLLLRCPGLTLLLLEAEEVALVEVYLQQPSDVSALLHGEVVESSRDSGSIEHQDYDRETLEGELVLVSLSNVEFVLLFFTKANKTIKEKRRDKHINTPRLEVSSYYNLHLLMQYYSTAVLYWEKTVYKLPFQININL